MQWGDLGAFRAKREAAQRDRSIGIIAMKRQRVGETHTHHHNSESIPNSVLSQKYHSNGATRKPTVQAYILTVDRPDGQRIIHALSEAKKLDITWSFVRGHVLFDREHPERYSRLLNFFFYRRSMTITESAVYLGHRRIWKSLLETEYEYAFILEDDFFIPDPKKLNTAIHDAVSNPSKWDIVKFFDVWPKRPIATIHLGSTRFVWRKYPPNGAVAYLINRNAANALLSRQQFYRPVDEDISRPWEFSLNVLSSEFNLVVENASSLGGSLLETERSHQESIRAQYPFRYLLMRNFLEASKYIKSLLYRRRLRQLIEPQDEQSR